MNTVTPDERQCGAGRDSDECLRRVWRCEHFSWWMTTMLHLPPGADPFDVQLRRSQLRYVTTSRAPATALAENYVGLETV
jgi:p-hydroxybenzoate 3-monooxygenase